MPVSSEVQASGRVTPGQLPATKVARTTYHGGYEGLGPAWGEFDKWLKDHGHSTAGDLWEVYTAGPETGNDATLVPDGTESTPQVGHRAWGMAGARLA